ncbi:hypothetical protein BO71DRAFT_316172 [Aspergillus ellipticus CBS 707.79]|uniref:C2H2-type domain-containing protein n=1 Tax=Aspergillus ellipticus CBS 707.79 TaxID=1448320 RepID=A0A319DLN9_9EURO|nr:hypothetical protein BO71DRAFT_316172 [Aspergillus ellipticus CBS 707.79]
MSSSRAALAGVRCPHEECGLYFPSIVAMQKHKVMEHEYCVRCDEDFTDEKRLFIHKLQNTNHIVCPMCGMEFRSEGGRDTHIRNYHRAQQSVTCVGCKQKFNQASALVRHIEADDCPEIPMARLLHEQSKKMIIKEALKHGESTGLRELPDPDGPDISEGGVKLNPTLLDTKNATLDHPVLSEKTMGAASSALLAFEDEADIPMTPKAPLSSQPIMPKSKPTVKSYNHTAQASAASREPKFDENAPFGVNNLDAGYTLRMLDHRWDPTTFFSSVNGLYRCPCGKEFTGMKKFEEHVLSKSNSRRTMQCPGCLRVFKSTAALVAHCESGTLRCSVNDGPRFGEVIDELSGGFVNAVGLHEDGTVKYEAGKMESTKGSTVGEDMQNHRKW